MIDTILHGAQLELPCQALVAFRGDLLVSAEAFGRVPLLGVLPVDLVPHVDQLGRQGPPRPADRPGPRGLGRRPGRKRVGEGRAVSTRVVLVVRRTLKTKQTWNYIEVVTAC